MGISERKEREKEIRRESILEAAEKVFFEKGLTSATMDEIAELTEVSKGTLYLYYKSKDDIYLGVICRGFDLLAKTLKDHSPSDLPTIQRLLNLGVGYYHFFQNYINYFRMFSYLDNPQFHSIASEEMLKESNRRSQQAWDIIIEVISRGVDDGTFKKSINPVQMAIILWSNATAIMKLKDRNDHFWLSSINVNYEEILQKSNSMLVTSMLTEEAKKYYQSKI